MMLVWKKALPALLAAALLLAPLTGCGTSGGPQSSTPAATVSPFLSSTLPPSEAPSPSEVPALAPSAAPSGGAVSVSYENDTYGFTFALPADWKNYSVLTDQWEGLSSAGNEGEKVTETGPKIILRDPRWTKKVPRQDIPIMVFTLAQWNDLQQENFHIGAAPIGPSELGRNNKYVFALPARYNFAFPDGYEEVETILSNAPLKATPLS